MTTFILDGIWGGHSRWEWLRRRIESEVGPCTIWRYDNSGRTSLVELGARLRSALQSLGEPVNLVGYSMGGLVVREAMRSNSETEIHRVALLHSPHGGSLAALALPLPACREMRPGSRFLKDLDATPSTVPTLVTWCLWDAVVVPGISARWKHATRVLQSHVPAHAWPVISPRIHGAVADFLKTTP